MKSEFVTAITQLAAEKGVPREMVMEAIQQALVSAYKQHEEDSRLITAEIDNESDAAGRGAAASPGGGG